MAQAVITYNLNDPDQRQEFRRVVASLDMACFIFEVLRNGRRNFKDHKHVDEIWEWLHQTADDHNINIDNLIS